MSVLLLLCFSTAETAMYLYKVKNYVHCMYLKADQSPL